MSERPSEIYLSLKTALEQAARGEVRKVDMVEVVRCKDCVFCQKFNEKYYFPKRDTLICANALYTEVHENDFCSWGERRSE